MIVRRVRRGSDSPFVAAISHVSYEGRLPDSTIPDGLWDIVVQKHAGMIAVLQTGLITRPVELGYGSGDEHLSISFRPGVYMPRLPGARMVDRGVFRPTISKRAFELDNDVFEIPSFENAEGLVERLVRRGLIVRDDIVDDVAEGRPVAMSTRAVERHFRWALGLTPKQLEQIHRANRAVTMLEAGRSPVDVAADLEFADQSHLTRSLKRFTGRTPGEIASLPSGR
jgi:AraC-like DNA-binding protein